VGRSSPYSHGTGRGQKLLEALAGAQDDLTHSKIKLILKGGEEMNLKLAWCCSSGGLCGAAELSGGRCFLRR